jgi:histidyl-tRNA synthetase
VPACGFALGLERILVVMAERAMYPAALAPADVVLGACHASELPAALALSSRLRAAGLRVDLRPKALKPGKLRKQADEAGVGAAVWLEQGHPDQASLWTRRDGHTASDLSAEALVERLRPAEG